MDENKMVIVCTFRLPYHELGFSCVPEHLSVVQAGNDILYTRPCVAIPAPAQLNGLPQFIAESQVFRLLRFLRSNPLRDRTDELDI
jgi:hypothetical protein